MSRPTLEEQIELSKMSDEELIDLIAPTRGWAGLDFWIFCHCEFLWKVIHWNWFDPYEGQKDADEYRPWYMKFKRKLFGGNKKDNEKRNRG